MDRYDKEEAQLMRQLAEGRRRSGWTQAEFGVELGQVLGEEPYARQSVSFWERCERRPSLRVLLAWADLVEMTWLLRSRGSESMVVPQDCQSTVERMSRLTKGGLDRVTRFVSLVDRLEPMDVARLDHDLAFYAERARFRSKSVRE